MNVAHLVAGVAISGLILAYVCAADDVPSGAVQTQPAKPAQSLSEMLPAGGWYPPNREALLKWLERKTREGAPATPHVAIFDWDNTAVFGDVEETFFQYALNHLAFRLTPEVLAKLTPESVNGVTELKGGIRLADVSADIRVAYAELWPLMREGKLDTARKLPAHADLRAKVGWLYEALSATPGIGEDYAYRWITFWLAGMTTEQVTATAEAALKAAVKDRIERQTWSAATAGRAGRLEYSFVHGLRAQPEIKALMEAIGTVGPRVYVVSASVESIVEAAAKTLDYPVAPERVFGVRLKMQDGKYLPELVDEAEYPFTYREGKVEAIRKVIKAAPVFVAGDSDGDYAMLTAFDSPQMRLVINRNKKGEMRKLYDEALKSAGGAPWPRTLLQGRDENTGAFRAGRETVPLGKSEPTLLRW